MFKFNDCKRITAQHKVTGNQYIIGTTTMIDCHGYETRYEYYSFRLEDVNFSNIYHKPTFKVVRCREIIGDQDTMDLFFEDSLVRTYNVKEGKYL